MKTCGTTPCSISFLSTIIQSYNYSLDQSSISKFGGGICVTFSGKESLIINLLSLGSTMDSKYPNQ